MKTKLQVNDRVSVSGYACFGGLIQKQKGKIKTLLDDGICTVSMFDSGDVISIHQRNCVKLKPKKNVVLWVRFYNGVIHEARKTKPEKDLDLWVKFVKAKRQ